MKYFSFQWMPRRCQSSRRTGISLKAFFRSILAITAPFPSWLTVAMAWSTVHYERVYASASIKSLTLQLLDADKWYIVCQPPSCFGVRPKPEQHRLGNGGLSYGPKMWPAAHSVARAASKMSGCWNVDGRFLLVCAKWGPLYPVGHPCVRLSIGVLTKE